MQQEKKHQDTVANVASTSGSERISERKTKDVQPARGIIKIAPPEADSSVFFLFFFYELLKRVCINPSSFPDRPDCAGGCVCFPRFVGPPIPLMVVGFLILYHRWLCFGLRLLFPAQQAKDSDWFPGGSWWSLLLPILPPTARVFMLTDWSL